MKSEGEAPTIVKEYLTQDGFELMNFILQLTGYGLGFFGIGLLVGYGIWKR